MSNRLPSDSSAVSTARTKLIRRGGSRQQCLLLPAEFTEKLSADDCLTVVIDSTECYSVVEQDARGLLLTGSYDNRRLARTTGKGTNRLSEWLGELDRETGSSVCCDEIVAGQRYGLRAPGERVIYTVKQGPRDSLQSIAAELDGERES